MLRGFTSADWDTYFYIKNSVEELPCKFFSQVMKDYNDLKDLKCLDIGCGIGLESKYLINKGFSVDAIDPEVPNEYLNDLLTNDKFRFIKGSICDTDILNSLANDYDIILAFTSMPYFSGKLDAIKKTVDEIYNRLKIGGIFIGSFLGEKHDWNGVRDAVFLSESSVDNLFEKFQIEKKETIYQIYEHCMNPYNYELHYLMVKKVC